ncbi:MAG TPA: hypothetical protein ENI17_13220 [Pseudomonas xinjiangensis]|uniref:Tim44-like domain-containing protein n=2 Tax=root TaxID=1 RepID=A0A7V1BNI8_9GAMM|nr:hypothetical protein [Halopseudomonas xinjiangensis]HEC48570.1 hypothetical protein [Halopseudomonas xinjiangensis]
MRWLLPFFTVFLMIGISVPDAEARRFGGGKSFGSAPAQRSQPAQRQQEQQAAPRNQAGQAAATSGARRWLGPLAGIAAGGLLAAMLFGDGFQGIQLFDILIVGLIAFVLFKLFSRRQVSQPHAQPAGMGHFPGNAAPPPATEGYSSVRPAKSVPAWFDEERFLGAAEEHFYTLQRNWRDGDTAGMAEYVDPLLLDEMLAARSENPPTPNGFVEQLSLRLDGIEEIAGRAVATVNFTGLDRDAPEHEGTWFDESWRLERAAGENQPWIIHGIRQNL